VLAEGGEREQVRGGVQQQARGGVEQLAAEIEDQGGEDKHGAPGLGIVGHHVGQALLVEGGLVDDPGAHLGAPGQDGLQLEGVADVGDVRSAALEAVAVGQGVGRVLREARPVQQGADEEHLAAVGARGAGERGHPAGLAQRHQGVAPHARRVLGLARAHGPDHQDAPPAAPEIEMVEGGVEAQVREAQHFQQLCFRLHGKP
jgi:hypothetical protein